MIFYIAQLIIPAALLLTLFLVAPSRRLALSLFIAGSFLWFAAIWIAGIWLVLPHWLVALYMAALAIGGWRAWRRGRASSADHEWRGRTMAALGGLLGAVALALMSQAHAALTPPEGPLLALASPLEGDGYIVANGGYSLVTNGGHHMTLDQSVPRFKKFFGQSMAIDIVKLDSWSRTTRGLRPADPATYEIFAQPVTAPCQGRIVTTRNDRPDMPVPVMDRSVMLGNHVIMQCGDYHVVLAHFRRGSVLVAPEDSVRTGQKLAEVGNSGNSAQPHLHLHAQLPGTQENPLSGNPVPITLDGRYLVRNDQL